MKKSTHNQSNKWGSSLTFAAPHMEGQLGESKATKEATEGQPEEGAHKLGQSTKLDNPIRKTHHH